MDIRKIQQALKDLGYDPGYIDGKDGPMTRRAVVAFQRAHGLDPDGIVGPATIAALTVDPIPERDITPPHALPEGHPTTWPRQKDVERFFGPVGSNQTMLHLPYQMRLAWEPSTIISRFSIHEKVHDSALRCFERIADDYSAMERRDLGLDLFGGCLNVRKMRGGNAWSMHSWGIAIDFDPARNQLKWGKERARLAQPDCRKFWEIWEDAGWVSLGRARDFDWQHVQAARL